MHVRFQVLEQYIWNDCENKATKEFKAFLWIIINMTFNPKPDPEEHFSQDLLTMMSFPPSFQKQGV